MITVINTEESATRTDTFTAITVGGRKMRIEVEAAKDVADMIILEDLRQSLHPGAAATVVNEKLTFLEGLGAILIIWLVCCSSFSAAVLVLDVADFINISSSFLFDRDLPLIGGYGFWTGLLRIYLSLLVILMTFWAAKCMAIKSTKRKL